MTEQLENLYEEGKIFVLEDKTKDVFFFFAHGFIEFPPDLAFT